jgi:hypothetical protein
MAIYRTTRLFARAIDATKVLAETMKRAGKTQPEIEKAVSKLAAKRTALTQRGRNLANNLNTTRSQINTINKNQSELSSLMAKQEAASQKQAQTSGFWGKLTGKNKAAARENQNLTNQITEMTQKNGTLEQMAAQKNNLNQTLAQDVENLNAFRNAKRGPSANKQVDSMIEGNQTFFQKRRQRRGELKQQITARKRNARRNAARAEHTGDTETAFNDALKREQLTLSGRRSGEYTQQRGQKKPIARSETTLANKPQQPATGGTKTEPATTQQPNTNTTQPGTGGNGNTTTGAQEPGTGGNGNGNGNTTTTGGTATEQSKGSWWSRLTGTQKGGIIGTGGILGGAGLTAGLMGGGGGTAATVAGAAAAPTLAAGYYYANKPREAAFSKNRNNINHVYRRPIILRKH